MSDRGRSIRHRVMTRRQDRQNRRSQLLNHFRQVTARTIPQTHNPRISAQTVTNHLREIGERPLYLFYMRRFFLALYIFSKNWDSCGVQYFVTLKWISVNECIRGWSIHVYLSFITCWNILNTICVNIYLKSMSMNENPCLRAV